MAQVGPFFRLGRRATLGSRPDHKGSTSFQTDHGPPRLRAEAGPSPPTLATLLSMDDDHLFLLTLEDLETCLRLPTEYNLLRTAALLRKLLLDASNLLTRVNRGHRLKLRFRFVRHELVEMPGARLVAAALTVQPGPQSPIEGHIVEGPVRQLLAAPGGFFMGHLASIKDLIRHASNIEGGVHRGDPKSDDERMLRSYGEVLWFNDLPAYLRAIQGVGQVVLEGLAPLRDAVLHENRPDDPPA